MLCAIGRAQKRLQRCWDQYKYTLFLHPYGAVNLFCDICNFVPNCQQLDRAEIRLIRFKRGSVNFQTKLPVPHSVRALFKIPRNLTVIGHQALNGQMRSEAHTAPTAPLALHRTRIGNCTMIKLGIHGQWWNKLFYCPPSFFTCKSYDECSARL